MNRIVLKLKSQERVRYSRDILCALLMLISAFSYSQIAPSPDAIGATYGSNPEDLYRGYVSEVVPLHTVTAKNGFQVPVQLSYQTRGVKVNDVASNVGLGWNLVAGGAITRVMRDQPDDQVYYSTTLNKTVADHKDAGLVGYDTEKDIFYYNFPGGSGRFINVDSRLDGDLAYDELHSLPYNNVKIRFFDATDHFEITDTNGIRFVFGESNDAKEHTTTTTYEEGSLPQANKDWTYISTWYLEEIHFPDLPALAENQIIFEYDRNDEDLEFSNTSHSRTYDFGEDYSICRIFNGNDPSNPQIRISPTYNGYPKEMLMTLPSNLPFNNQVVVHPGWVDHWNILDDACTNIPECVDAVNNWLNIQGIPWAASYFAFNVTSVKLDPVPHVWWPIYKFSGGTSDTPVINDVTIETSRLVSISSIREEVKMEYSDRSDFNKKLDRLNVYEKGYSGINDPIITSVEFDYDYFQATGCSSPVSDCRRLKLSSVEKNGLTLASFEYTDALSPDYNLPERSSSKIDRYGYYNKNASGIYAGITVNPYRLLNTDPSDPYYNAPIGDYPGATSVSVGSGSRNPSVYAQAGSLWKVSYPSGATKEFTYSSKWSGGIRLVQLQVYDGSGTRLVDRSYSYSEGVRMNSALNTPVPAAEVTLFSDSPYLGYDHLAMGGYNKVTTVDNLLGYSTDYEFWSSTEGATPITKKHRKSNWVDLENGNLPLNYAPMIAPAFNPFYGLLKYRTKKDALGKKISHEFFDYDYTESPVHSIAEHLVFKTDDGEYFTATTNQNCRSLYHTVHTTENYDENEVPIAKNKTSYFYNSQSKGMVSGIVSERDDQTGGESHNTTTEMYYASDYNNGLSDFYPSSVSFFLGLINDRNMIANPVAVVNKINVPTDQVGYWVNSASYTTFQWSGLQIKPHQSFAYYPTGPVGTWYTAFDPELVSTQTYGTDGLLSSITGMDGITKSYVYNGYGQVTSETIDPGVPSMKRTTSYTYEPLVGIKTVTDPTGESVTYEYDDRNRLHLIRDKDNNIVKRYRYNYGLESGLSATIIRTGAVLVGSTVQFSVGDLVTYGETEMNWSILEDGVTEVATGSGATIDLPITAADITYTVKLALVSPEYDNPFNTEMSVTSYACSDAFSSIGLSGAFVGGTATINMAIPDEIFTISSVSESASWVTSVSTASDGKSFTFNYSSNPSTASRAVTFNVNLAGCSTQQVSFNQNGQPDGPGQCLPGCYWDATTSSCICN